MKNLNQYKAHVDNRLSKRINSLIENIEAFDIYKGYADCLSEDVYPIEGNYVSGWLPKQDGGMSKNFLFHLTEDSSTHFTAKQTEAINKYIEDNPELFKYDWIGEDPLFDDPLGHSYLTTICYVKENKVIFELELEYLDKKEILYNKEFSFKEFKELDRAKFIENLYNKY